MITRYFRTHIMAPARDQDLSLLMRIIVDDGAVFYVNGREAYRFRLPPVTQIPADAIGYGTTGINISDPSLDGPFNLPATNLVAGDNVIAVEVHQNSTDSTDATLGMELIALVTHFASGPVVIENQPQAGTVAVGQSYTFRVSASGEVPISYQWYHNDSLIPGATKASYAIPVANASHAGNYYVLVMNPRGSVASVTAPLTVILDTVPPRLLAAKGSWASNTTISVSFSKILDPVLAQDVANYRLLGPGDIQITNALLTSGSNVTLRLTGPRQANVTYTLEVKDLRDTANPPNTLAPNPSVVPVATLVELISLYSHRWKFLEQSAAGAAAPCLDGMPWTAPVYDDSAWSNGLAIFYGARSNNLTPIVLPIAIDANNPATTIAQTKLNLFTNETPPNALQEITYYFRTTFDLPAETNGIGLYVYSFADDGAIIYLNGNRCDNWRMTNAQYYCTNFADQSVGLTQWNPALTGMGRIMLSTGLKRGQNTLAVELHQGDGTSSDAAFGAVLQAEVLTFIEFPRLSFSYDRVGQNLTLSWTAGSEWKLYQANSATGPWLQGAETSPYVITPGGNMKFFRLQQTTP
jgi:hypothetical protein